MRRLLTPGSLALAAALALTALAPTVRAQTPPAAPAPFVPGDTTDVRFSTPDSVIANLYRVISGPAGQARDWAFFRRLFLPEASLMAVGRRARPDGRAYVRMTPDEYVQRAGPSLEQRGFFERELHREAEQYALVYHAFSTYDSRAKADDATPFARGINSIQLVRQHGRWWVLSVLWTDEASSGVAIPEAYR